MSLILHLIRKDFALLRVRLATWLFVIAAKHAVGFYLIYSADFGQREFTLLPAFVLVFSVTEGALTMVLAAILVQEDGLIGATQFWRTRPVSGARLGLAKVLGAVVLLGLPPVLLAVPWWLACGLDAGQIVRAAGEVFGLQAILLVLAFGLAVVTDGLGRFLVWGLVAFFAVEVIAASIRPARPIADSGSRLLLQVGITVVSIAAVVAVQYCTRNRLRALVLLGAGVGLGILAGQYSPWSLLPSREARAALPPFEAERAAGVSVAAAVPRATGKVATRSGEREMNYVALRFDLRGVPREHAVLAGWGDFEWKWPGAASIRADSFLTGDATPAIRALLAISESESGTRVMPPVERADMATLEAQVPLARSIATRLGQESHRFQATLNLDLVRPELCVELPLAGAGWQTGRGRGVRVMHIEHPRNSHTQPVIIETLPASFLQDLLAPTTPSRGRESTFAVVNRRDGFVQASFAYAAASAYLAGVQVRGVLAWVPRLRAEPSADGEKKRQAWERDATLALITFPVVAQFERTVQRDVIAAPIP